MDASVVNEIVKKIKILPGDLQHQVLVFVDALQAQVSSPGGVSGELLLKFAGTISANDLKAMHEAIEAGCERVDGSEW
jgi:hypothetical protein